MKIVFETVCIFFPNFGPKDLKLGLAFLTRISDESLINSTFFTLISDLIKSSISKISFFSPEFLNGIKTLFRGCLTLIFSLFLIERAIEQII